MTFKHTFTVAEHNHIDGKFIVLRWTGDVAESISLDGKADLDIFNSKEEAEIAASLHHQIEEFEYNQYLNDLQCNFL
jgi:hypothetical protein